MDAARGLEFALRNALTAASLLDAAAVAALLAAMESAAVHQLKHMAWKMIALAAAVLPLLPWLSPPHVEDILLLVGLNNMKGTGDESSEATARRWH